MSTPFFGLYPLFRPKRIMILSYVGGICSNCFLSRTSNGSNQFALSPPDYGRLIIYVNVGYSGIFGFKIANAPMGYNNGAIILNGGNALSANVWYKFEVPSIPDTQYFFWWLSSSSSVGGTSLQLVVFWEPAEIPPSAGATD